MFFSVSIVIQPFIYLGDFPDDPWGRVCSRIYVKYQYNHVFHGFSSWIFYETINKKGTEIALPDRYYTCRYGKSRITNNDYHKASVKMSEQM